MPDAANIQAQAIQLRQVLQGQGTNRQRIREILTAAATELGDQFGGTLDLAVRGLPLEQQIRQVAQRLIPPPQLPPGITLPDINGNIVPEIDPNWSLITNAMRGRVFNVNQHTAGLVNRWLAEEGLTNNNSTAAQRGAALARAGWRDNFFSSMELAAVFQYSQTLNEADRTQFQQAFVQEFTREVQRKFPGQERYIMMQFTRFMNNTNWDSNDGTTQGFRTFVGSILTGLAEASLTEAQRRELQDAPGRRTVLATYDIPDERGNFGAACLIGSYERGPDGVLRFQTSVVSHRPGRPENRWRFDFGQAQQPAQPPQQPLPGFGNLLRWIQQWLQWLQQMPPLQPPAVQPTGPQPPGIQPPPGPQPPVVPPLAPPGGIPIPGNRPADVHIDLITQHARLQATIQAIRQTDHGGVDVSDDLRELEEISNQLGTLIRQGDPNEAAQIRLISNRLNQFHDRISSQDNGVLNNFSEEILGVSTSLNQVAGRIVQNNFHENVGNVRDNFSAALDGLTNLFNGPISQEQRERGEAIQALLQELARADRPLRPDDANRLRRIAADITAYANGLQDPANPSRNPHLDRMRTQARELERIADSLAGVPITPPPGGPAAVRLGVGRISPQTLRYLSENGLDIATPEITADNVNTARDEILRLMREHQAEGQGGTTLRGMNRVRLFNFMIRYMEAINTYYQNNYGDNAETRINDVMPGVNDWGTAINRYRTFRDNLPAA